MAVFFVLVGMEVKRELFEGPFQAINKRFSLPLLPLAEWLFLPWFIFFIAQQDPALSRWLGNPNGNRHCLCTRYHGVIKQTSATPIKNLFTCFSHH